MKKIFRKIHLWLSVPFGLIITLICFSGAMLVFEDDVMELLHRDLYYVKKTGATPLPANRIAEAVSAILPDSVAVTGISIASDPERTWQVNLSHPRRASVYVDPYTGEVKGKSERAPFFTTMFRLHRWLLHSMKPGEGIFWGKMIVGTATLMFVFVLISGLIVWLPRTAKAFKNSLKVVTDKGWRRFCYSLHVAGGISALVFLLIMALTGLTLSFSWYRTGFYKVFGVEMRQEGSRHAGAHDSGRNRGGENNGEGKRDGKGEGRGKRNEGHPLSPFTHWQTVYETLKEQNPDYNRITLSKDAATVSFNRWGNQRAADRYTFNPQNGKITEIVLYKDMETSSKIRGWIYSVHVGAWGGLITRILAFLAALIGASLPLTGYYLWIRRIIGKRKKSSLT